MTFNYSRST